MKYIFYYIVNKWFSTTLSHCDLGESFWEHILCHRGSKLTDNDLLPVIDTVFLRSHESNIGGHAHDISPYNLLETYPYNTTTTSFTNQYFSAKQMRSHCSVCRSNHNNWSQQKLIMGCNYVQRGNLIKLSHWRMNTYLLLRYIVFSSNLNEKLCYGNSLTCFNWQFESVPGICEVFALAAPIITKLCVRLTHR